MTENKLLNRLEVYLGLDKKHRREKASEMEKVIKKLKKKEKALIAQCESTDDDEQHSMLEKRISVLHAQRKKGLKALKKINKEEQ